jgi:hypothetical protein
MARVAPYRAMYAYAWDLADEGVGVVVDAIRALGLNTITLAGSYHAGKFLRPHGRTGRVYFPEDGTIYFRHEPSRYGSIAPVPNSLIGDRDVLDELTSDRQLAVNVWLVLLHNSRLGAQHPRATVTNAFGDRYVYSLCPSAPEVREYAVALCGDVANRYDIAGLTLETPGFLPYVHGYHHEFSLVTPDARIDRLLALCFCDRCVRGAEAAGVDATGLQQRVRQAIDGWLNDADLPDGSGAAGWRAALDDDDTLARFISWRCGVVTSLVQDIRTAVRRDAAVAVIPSVARPNAGAWLEGSDIRALGEAAGIVEACLYEPNVERLRADLLDTQSRLQGAGTLRGVLRPAHPDLHSRDDVIAAARACRDAGVVDVAFYNYGHLPRRNLAWIADAIAALES